MRIVFLGTGEIGVPSLRALAESSAHLVCAVFTQPDRPAGRDLKLRPSAIKVLAGEKGIPVYQPERIRTPESIELLRSLNPDILIVAAYGQILPRTILDLPALGCLNIHASLLPRHRGASPIHAAILSGDAESGITIMWMAEGLDTGDILLPSSTPIGRHETGGGLHDRLALLAPSATMEALKLIAQQKAPHVPQEESLATYAPKLKKEDGLVDWSRTAVEIGRQIRAMTPWPGAFTYLPTNGTPTLLKIHEALIRRRGKGTAGEILRADKRGILVAAGEGAVLLRCVQTAGGKRLAAADFLRGRTLEKGISLSSIKN